MSNFSSEDKKLLFFSWIDHLSAGNQKSFANKSGINESTISRLKSNKDRGVGKSTIERMCKAYGLSLKEFDLGPKEYERQKKEAKQPTKSNYLRDNIDKSQLSDVYPLSGIGKDLSRSQWIGWCSTFFAKEDPKEYFQVYIDVDGRGYERQSVINIQMRDPQPGEPALVWTEEKKAHFITFKEAKPGQIIHGTVVGQMIYQSLPEE
jgi:DNA-binding Xre family transcriptional regulator